MLYLRPFLAKLPLLGLRLCLCLGCALPLGTRGEEISEYGMKAVLFYRLSQFIYWPEQNMPPSPAILCVVGKNPFGATITQIDQNTSAIEVRVAPTDLGSCNLLFISRSESSNLDNWLKRIEGINAVSVSDIPGFARNGGMIELPLEGERIGIVINRRSAQRKNIEFKAQLLRLARIIEQ